MTCEVCCIVPADRCSRDIGGEWLCDVCVCGFCRDEHDREAHPPEPDYDYAMEQRRDDVRRT